MQLMDFRAWISSLPGHPTQTEAADASGVDRSTLSRQLKRGTLSMEVVADIARAHGVKPADALVHTGHLAPDDINGVGVVEALHKATNRQLFTEIETRSDMESTVLFGKSAGIINPRPLSDVDSNGRVPPRPSDKHDGTVRKWDDSIPHAADSSTDEQKAREEEGSDPID